MFVNCTVGAFENAENQLSFGAYIGTAVAIGVIGSFGFTMNLVVAVIIVRNVQDLWTPVNVIVLNLAVCLPMVTLGLASIGILAVIAIERWLLIIRPTRVLSIRRGWKARCKSTKMAALIITALLVALLTPAALSQATQNSSVVVSPSVAVIATLFAKSSVYYDPVFYAVLNRQFSRPLKKLLGLQDGNRMAPGCQQIALIPRATRTS